MTSRQAYSMMSKKPSDQTTPIHSTTWNDNIALRSQETVCGLFNQETPPKTDTGTMENLQSIEKNQSKFSKRLSEANLHINLIKPVQTIPQAENEFCLDLDHLELSNLISPETTKICLGFLQSMPSPVFETSITTEKILETSGINEIELSELAAIQTSQLYDPTRVNNYFDEEFLSLEHGYSTKRKLSEDFDESTMFSQDSFNVYTPSTSSNTESTKKKHRNRGVYRAQDVKTDEDLANYIEKRKKNNVSSKISRSNKNTYYNSMDAKCDELELENNNLKTKIQKLEDMTKTLKDFLLQNFNKNN